MPTVSASHRAPVTIGHEASKDLKLDLGSRCLSRQSSHSDDMGKTWLTRDKVARGVAGLRRPMQAKHAATAGNSSPRRARTSALNAK